MSDANTEKPGEPLLLIDSVAPCRCRSRRPRHGCSAGVTNTDTRLPTDGTWLQARFRGLPENTPLVEQVEVDEEAGAPRTAMQIAADKYRQRAPAATKRAPTFPEPKKRDQFLEFPVMPCALPHAACCVLHAVHRCPGLSKQGF